MGRRILLWTWGAGAVLGGLSLRFAGALPSAFTSSSHAAAASTLLACGARRSIAGLAFALDGLLLGAARPRRRSGPRWGRCWHSCPPGPWCWRSRPSGSSAPAFTPLWNVRSAAPGPLSHSFLWGRSSLGASLAEAMRVYLRGAGAITRIAGVAELDGGPRRSQASCDLQFGDPLTPEETGPGAPRQPLGNGSATRPTGPGRATQSELRRDGPGRLAIRVPGTVSWSEFPRPPDLRGAGAQGQVQARGPSAGAAGRPAPVPPARPPRPCGRAGRPPAPRLAPSCRW